MTALLQAATRAADLLLRPVAGQPTLALALAAALFGALAVLLFKLATPQRRLGAARSLLIGRLHEAALYQTSLSVIFRVQGRLVAANLRYVAFALPGLAALLVPLLLVLPQLDVRFGRRPLVVGETALVVVEPAADAARAATPALSVGPGLQVESGPLRRPDTGELFWRLRAAAPGWHEVRLDVGAAAMALPVPVAVPGLPAVTRAWHKDAWRQALRDPAGEPLANRSEVARVRIEMPARESRLLGWRAHWLVVFTLVALVVGLLLRRPLRVEL